MDKGALLAERVQLIDGAVCSLKTQKPIYRALNRGGYYCFTIRCRGKIVYYSEHRAIWFLHYGSWPNDTIDHINHVRTDNRIENLRDISREENSRGSRGCTGHRWRRVRLEPVKGWVTPYRTGFQAFIKPRSRFKVYLGKYPTFEQADAARNAASRLLAELRADPSLLGEVASDADLLSAGRFSPLAQET